ncbi:MAG: serine hydrolase [Acidobacteria bacterium]|nr:serine hydrolase [Acidobacteriota bacterium]
MTRGLFAAAVFVIAAQVYAQPADDAARLAEFKAFAAKYRTEHSVLSLSYAIVKDGRIVAAEGFGWQDHDAEERTTADTSYLVASITKTFTGATLLAMDADEVIDLDAREGEGRFMASPLPNPEMNASSGIIASARSLAEYSLALDQGRILARPLLEQMWTPPNDPDGRPASYACGWWTQQWRGQPLVWHSGNWPDAYAGLLLKVPRKGLTLVALGNTDGLNWDNRVQVAEVEKLPLALKFLELFAQN